MLALAGRAAESPPRPSPHLALLMIQNQCRGCCWVAQDIWMWNCGYKTLRNTWKWATMQSNGIMKSTALALEKSVSPAGALDALEKERRQPKVKHCCSPSAFPALHSAEAVLICQGPLVLPFSPWVACPTFSVFGRGGRRCWHPSGAGGGDLWEDPAERAKI